MIIINTSTSKFRNEIPRIISYFKIFLTILKSPSKRVVFYVRLCHYLNRKKVRTAANIIKNHLATRYGVYISLKTKIKGGLRFPHPTGIVLGDKVEIGKNVTIYQQVTLGGKNIGDGEKGAYPIIEDNVILFSGCKILGPITIGKGSIIGANSVVTKDVDEYSVYAGIPAKKIKDLKE